MRDFQLPGRSPVRATEAMAATSHPLATLAAIDMLRSGGNAMDAAVCCGGGAGGGRAAIDRHRRRLLRALLPQGRGRGAGLQRFGPRAGCGDGGLVSGQRAMTDCRTRAACRHRAGRHRRLVPAARGSRQEGHRRRAGAGHSLCRTGLRRSRPRRLRLGRRASPCSQPTNMPRGSSCRTAGHRRPATCTGSRNWRTPCASSRSQGRAGFYEGEVADDLVARLRALGGLHALEDFAAHEGRLCQARSTRPIAATTSIRCRRTIRA